MKSRRFTEGQWFALGASLFGDDRTLWRFRCPTCGIVMTLQRARSEFPEALEGGYRVEQECIGRYVQGVGCDWAAYGLFHGPWFVERSGGGATPVFPFDEIARMEVRDV